MPTISSLASRTRSMPGASGTLCANGSRSLRCRYILVPASDSRALPVERLVFRGIDIAGVELLHMRQQRLGEIAPFDLIIAQRVLPVVMQRLECVLAIDPHEAAIVVDHFAVAHDGTYAVGLGALNHRVEHRHLLIEIRIGNLLPVD